MEGDTLKEAESVLQSSLKRAHLERQKRCWDGQVTATTIDQEACEEKCARFLIPFDAMLSEEQDSFVTSGLMAPDGSVQFLKEAHERYLESHLGKLGNKYMSQASA